MKMQRALRSWRTCLQAGAAEGTFEVMWSLLLRVAVGASMAFVTMSGAAKEASADIGPIEPARRICMGQAAGAPCEIDGRAGTCQGPHPSRMYCTPMREPAKPSPARKPAPVSYTHLTLPTSDLV